MEEDQILYEKTKLRPLTLFRKGPLDRITCIACNHYCVLSESESGICGIRENHGGRLMGLWGYVSYARLDPIERKPIFHFMPGTSVYSIGTVGCNFKCVFCQNHTMTQAHDTYPLTRMPPLQVVRIAKRQKAQGIAFTFNEPTITPEFVRDTSIVAHKKGLYTVLVTNGYLSKESIEYLMPHIDAATIGFKTFDVKRFSRECSASLDNLKRSVDILSNSGIHIELSFMVRDEDDSFEDFLDYYFHLSHTHPLHLVRYFPEYMSSGEPTSNERMESCYKRAKERGVPYVYISNLYGSPHENTYCPRCEALLIERSGSIGEPSVSCHCAIFEVVEDNLKDDSTCPVCNEYIPVVTDY